MTNARLDQRSSAKLAIASAFMAIAVAGIAVSNPQFGDHSAAVLNEQSESMPEGSQEQEIRARQLIFKSEDLRKVPEIWERAWDKEMIPDPVIPYRMHGGVI